MHTRFLLSVLCTALVACGIPNGSAASGAIWPEFRGPNGSGVAAKAKPPVKITPTNFLWRTEVPWSPSSPSIWGDSIFLTTLANGQLETRCYSRMQGDLVWSRLGKVDKLETFHRTEGSPAAAMAATGVQRVVSYC